VRALEPDSRVERVLARRPLVGLGRRSYSLYLWHLPIISLIGVIAPHTLNGALLVRQVTGVAIAFVLACASYRFVEQPFLQRKRRTIEPRAEPIAAPARAA
jgi:peptidoglycan/LPS O-acetylase OafA/YrhL